MARLPVTVVVPAKNEERNLSDCLGSVARDFVEIVVVDSSSTDATPEIAKAFGAVVLNFEWDGRFPKKRNWVLRKHKFVTPWVLFLDADERVTAEFVDELERVLPYTGHVGFWIRFTNWYLGSPLKYGDVFHKLALFRVGAGEYERLPEEFWSQLDMEVHEHPVLHGTTGEVRSRLEHHEFRSLEEYRSKHIQYAMWETKRFQWLNSAGPEEWSRLTARQRFKYRNLNKAWLPWFYWFVAYVLKGGFLDGRAGWKFNSLKRCYFLDICRQITVGNDMQSLEEGRNGKS